ncbi:gtp-binding protein 10-like protein [Dermatophagoides farinae]|uniref:Gtp-binding protein 10-like protein n=1 Tax=Dermatophagoides farinae TaxID=6954 RepID=A0A9D4SDV4_DERFA|nr:GTP-binding protein 10 homolog [Dermatophagoides farinae]KAH7637420.1 gtp-binding protein 10-like protein [Dermatophagoides farinae]
MFVRQHLMIFKVFHINKAFSSSYSSVVSHNQVIESNGRVFVKDKYRRFIDQIRITVTGGAGGNGYPKYQGLGGNGGNVCLVANADVKLNDLKKSNVRFCAEDGQHSSRNSIIGQDGKDLEIKVPVGISVISDEYKKEIAHLDKPGDKCIVAFGGRGGDKINSYCGTNGQKLAIKLDLKLLADIGLVGYPNAGKSTLLRALSRASPKIASYPFTTIQPNLGVIEYDPPKTVQPYNDWSKVKDKSKFYEQDYRRITVADLPGLIDGAHRNIGLGHKFLKHIMRTNLLLFIVDIDGFRNTGGRYFHDSWCSHEPFEVIQSLINEIDLYDNDILEQKPSILVVSKLDTFEKRDQFNRFVEILQQTNIDIPSVMDRQNVIKSSDDDQMSSMNVNVQHDSNNNQQHESTIEHHMIEGFNDANDDENDNDALIIDHHPPNPTGYRFDKIIGISAVTGYNIDQLKGLIRKLIDLNAENNEQQQYGKVSHRQR